MRMKAAWQFIVPDDATDIETQAEAIMDSLVDLEQVDDRLSSAAVGLDLAAMTLDIEVTVTGNDYEECVNHALAAVRTAIHSAGGATPGWPRPSAGRASFEPQDFRAVPA